MLNQLKIKRKMTEFDNGEPKEFEEGSNLEEEEQEQAEDEQAALNKLPILSYLDKTVMADLMKGLDELTKERPADPIEFLGLYMLKQSEN